MDNFSISLSILTIVCLLVLVLAIAASQLLFGVRSRNNTIFLRVFFAVLIASLLGFWGIAKSNLSPEDIPDLKREGAQLIPKIEEFRNRHGTYPQTLLEAGVTPKIAKRWGYVLSAGGTNFSLSIGEYDKNDFTMVWDVESQDGYVDQ